MGTVSYNSPIDQNTICIWNRIQTCHLLSDGILSIPSHGILTGDGIFLWPFEYFQQIFKEEEEEDK